MPGFDTALQGESLTPEEMRIAEANLQLLMNAYVAGGMRGLDAALDRILPDREADEPERVSP